MLSAGLIIIGVTGFLAGLKQKRQLENQIRTFSAAVQIAATKDDIQGLTAHIDDGFSNLVAAIKGVKPPPPTKKVTPVEPQLPPPLVRNLVFTQRRAPSTDPRFPYGLQVIIQSNINIQPVGFAFVCDGEISKVDFFVAGQGAYFNVLTGISGDKKNVGLVKFSFPALTPETPLVVTLLSKTDVRVVEVQQVP
jgi:hypothetical protein